MAPLTQVGFSKAEKTNTLFIASILSFRMLGLFMVFPILANDISLRWPNTSLFLVGLSLGIYGLTQATLQIPFGLLSDRFGRKPLIIFGLMLFMLGSIIAAVADSVYWLILGRALQGCGAIAAVLLALLADLIAPQNRTRGLAFVGMSIGTSFLISLWVGPIIYSLGGMFLVFILTAVLSLIGLVIVLMMPTVKASSVQRVELKSIAKMLFFPKLWQLNLGVFIIHACLTALFLVVPIALSKQFEIPISQHWQFYLSAMLLSILLTIPLILLAEKKKKIRLAMQLSALLIMVGILSLMGTPSVLWLGFLLVLFFAGFNILEATLPSLLSQLAPTKHRGTAMGIFSSSQFFGAFVGGSLGGYLISTFGNQALLGFMLILLLTWFLSTWVLQVKSIYVSKTLCIATQLPSTEVENWCLKQEGVMEVTYINQDGTLILKIISEKFNLTEFQKNIETRIA